MLPLTPPVAEEGNAKADLKIIAEFSLPLPHHHTDGHARCRLFHPQGRLQTQNLLPDKPAA